MSRRTKITRSVEGGGNTFLSNPEPLKGKKMHDIKASIINDYYLEEDLVSAVQGLMTDLELYLGPLGRKKLLPEFTEYEITNMVKHWFADAIPKQDVTKKNE